MKIRFVEVTNGKRNWGKFMLAKFDAEEWERRSVIDGLPIISQRGWRPHHTLVLDLQTGEGAFFKHGGDASYDLNKHKIWVCPMYEPFLNWLYRQPDPMDIPDHVDLPDAEFEFRGHRRPGPGDVEHETG